MVYPGGIRARYRWVGPGGEAAQAEVETFALEPDGQVRWRAAHSDVVAAAELLAGRLLLASYGGQVAALDAETGRSVD